MPAHRNRGPYALPRPAGVRARATILEVLALLTYRAADDLLAAISAGRGLVPPPRDPCGLYAGGAAEAERETLGDAARDAQALRWACDQVANLIDPATVPPWDLPPAWARLRERLQRDVQLHPAAVGAAVAALLGEDAAPRRR
jgi:hypothetical protein